MSVDISGIDKALLLAALTAYARGRGISCVYAATHRRPDMDQVRQDIASRSGDLRFDTYLGRMIHADISSDAVDPTGYDRVNDRGAFAHVVAALR
jgi:hypothetical protein